MKHITFLILLCIAQLGFSQTTQDYEHVISKISESYNAKNAAAIFEICSSKLQATFSQDQIQEFITKNQENKGAITSSSFLLEEGSEQRYLTEFDNGTSILVVMLDPQMKLTKLALEEY